jgi:hypothetical protein
MTHTSHFSARRLASCHFVVSATAQALVVAALAPALRGQVGGNPGDNDDTTRHLSGRSVRVLAFGLAFLVFSKPDDDTGTRSRESKHKPGQVFAMMQECANFMVHRIHCFPCVFAFSAHIWAMKKRKRLTAKGKIGAAVVQTAAASAIETGPKGGDQEAAPWPPAGIVVRDVLFPPPEYLLEEAQKESNRKLLQDYSEVIGVLREEKGFSFREIAEWLTQKGIDADYNAVYRVYTKGMSEDEEQDVALREAEEENERP